MRVIAGLSTATTQTARKALLITSNFPGFGARAPVELCDSQQSYHYGRGN